MKPVLAILIVFAVMTSTVSFADVASGQSVYLAKGCIGCHGFEGKSNIPTNPSLAGRDAAFVKTSLLDFRSGTRKNPIMNAMAAGLTDEEINHLANYIGNLK